MACGVFAPSATAATTGKRPPDNRLEADCRSGKGRCTFKADGPGRVFRAPFRQVSKSLLNCSTSDVSKSMGWEDSLTVTDEAGISLNLGSVQPVAAGITANLSHGKAKAHVSSGTVNITVKPQEVGWIARAPLMHQATGKWTTHYVFPVHRRWHWKIAGTVVGPVENGTAGKYSAVMVKTRQMTEQEVAACASRHKPRPKAD
ncbi:hypothetical protein [Streptomyces sp. ODS05-4]|uniref:hypothetical protein n=1 Tax=Streptomyces sp. ODS05-4 TaxID=2944939 RepID=UPI00210DEB95|nr:hypothetical protein [Streptomyces sp. ODS05-4]